jgi:hypothetical protein
VRLRPRNVCCGKEVQDGLHATGQQIGTREKALADGVARRTVFETARRAEATATAWPPHVYATSRYLPLCDSARPLRTSFEMPLASVYPLASPSPVVRSSLRTCPRPVSTVSSPAASWQRAGRTMPKGPPLHHSGAPLCAAPL